MAVVTGPALSLQASGNLGSICYSSWRELQIARAVWTGTVPNTALQLAQQSKMTTVSQAWGGSLTVDERESWNESAKSVRWVGRLGSAYIPNGYQLYMKINIRRLVIGLAILVEAPVNSEWVYVDHLNLFINPMITVVNVELLQKASTIVDGYGVEYYKAGPFDSGGRRPIEGEWRFYKRRVPPFRQTDGTVILGKWYWYRGRVITEFGEVQNWFEEQIHFN